MIAAMLKLPFLLRTMPLDVALFVEALATDLGMFVPLGCAKLILSTRASAQHLQTLSSTLRKPTSQAIFRGMLKYHAEAHDSNVVLVPAENLWQHLGMAIAGGADPTGRCRMAAPAHHRRSNL